jgi:predicted RNase H-like nuclease (RuvC/YqgF family)
MRLKSLLAKRIPGGRLEGVRQRLDRQRKALDGQRERIRKHERRLDKVEATARLLVMDFARIEHQLSALEAKVERIGSERVPTPVTGDAREVAQARNVVELVQQEHEQIRARFQIITRYEERLRRVEDVLLSSGESAVDGSS